MSMLDTLAGSPPPMVPVVPGVHIVPYDASYDTQASAFLPYLWERMRRDDLVDYYFPGQKDTGFSTFVRLMSGDAHVALVTRDDPSHQWDSTVVGFVSWSTSLMGMSNVVIAGFNFFREFWDHHTTDAAAVAAFNFWFSGDSPVEVVLGSCPATHAVAMRYNKRVGLRETGRIPLAHIFRGERCDAVLYAITREEWRARCQQRP